VKKRSDFFSTNLKKPAVLHYKVANQTELFRLS